MIQIENSQAFSSEGKPIRRKGADTHFMRCIALPGDTADSYEEADEVPAYSKEEYDAKVARLVRERYSESEEFAIQRKAINAAFTPSATDPGSSALAEFAEYNAFVEQCKAMAKEQLAIMDTSEN